MNRQKYNLILETAEKLFNRFGIGKTAVEEIASQARVAKGTIYNNFGSKEELLKKLMLKKASEFEESAEKIFGALEDPVKRMKSLLKERVTLLQNTPFLSDSMIKADGQSLSFLYTELDRRLKMFIGKILDGDISRSFTSDDKRRIGDTVTFTLRGIEQTIEEAVENISLQKIEGDLDYLIRLIFPEPTGSRLDMRRSR